VVELSYMETGNSAMDDKGLVFIDWGEGLNASVVSRQQAKY